MSYQQTAVSSQPTAESREQKTLRMKKNERKTARILFVEQHKSQKEISGLLNVTEKTVSAWVQKYNWKTERNARVQSQQNRTINIRLAISRMAEQRLIVIDKMQGIPEDDEDYNAKMLELHKQAASIDDGVAKWNKALERIEEKEKITLSTTLEVMETIFKSMQKYDIELFMSSLDFQEMFVKECLNKFS